MLVAFKLKGKLCRFTTSFVSSQCTGALIVIHSDMQTDCVFGFGFILITVDQRLMVYACVVYCVINDQRNRF